MSSAVQSIERSAAVVTIRHIRVICCHNLGHLFVSFASDVSVWWTGGLHSALLTYFDENKMINQYHTRQKDYFDTYVVNMLTVKVEKVNKIQGK